MKWGETGFRNWQTVLQRFSFSVSKVIRNCFGLALLRSVIGLKNSYQPLNQSDGEQSDGELFRRVFLALAPFKKLSVNM